MSNRPQAPSLKLVHSRAITKSSATSSDAISHKEKKQQHLQLVATTSPINDATSAPPQTSHRKPEQLSLFEEGERVLLGIINIDRIGGTQFEALLREIRPKWLIDLRVVPDFLIDRLNRKYVFHIFEQCRIEYLDMMTALRIRSRKDASLSSGRIAQEITRIWKEHDANTVLGSIIFLVDNDEMGRVSANIFPEKLEPRPKAGWDTRFLN